MTTRRSLSPILLLLTQLVVLIAVIATAQKFEPYEINGGLTAAVSGRNFAILASDTRLTDGGYGIKSRRYTSSRLFRVGGGTNGGDGFERAMSGGDIVKCSTSGAMIGCSGCAADCDALRRVLQIEARSHSHSSPTPLTADSIATLLSNVLYSRRSFPFYSFCVVCGLDPVSRTGVVHVYDAIGSHERVAVGCSGTGKEMLQPVLDRLFSSVEVTKEVDGGGAGGVLRRDAGVVSARDQSRGLSLAPPVQTHVQCETAEEAVSLVLRGYRSVAEREISVGDEVVICVLRFNDDVGDGSDGSDGGTVQVLRFPLKKH
mmetsp:Transcript_23199/g.26666  ORF Transcript_23199/g.26666 Transcript_23199/m.26666 type:complete len:316 (-) Transcript_23199:479-1426(-)|eukprot:CAMPEP_0194370424 /NCGR_PEP_ID=MMETSP0174-20130528/18722_1 /TAXON_ID=216777 /ORGANISM="Proboscia alata, Strain PI-D3" /LENGTH=315 /DNA_ID=CAMNT_0039147885 /DNA_START=63 /DNA_END=1010 /DNA_ORIENTATION=-